MKRILCASVLFYISLCFCTGASYEVGDQVTQLAAMHDYDGGTYILYVQNGQLKALHENAGGNMSPYRIFGENDGELFNAILYEKKEIERDEYIFISGKRNGNQSVYLIYADRTTGNLAYTDLSFDATGMQNMTVTGKRLSELLIFYTKSGSLYLYSTADATENKLVSICESYAVSFLEETKTSYGYYTVPTEKGYGVYLFTSDMNGRLSVSEVDSLYRNPIIKQDLNTKTGKCLYVITDGQSYETYLHTENNLSFLYRGKSEGPFSELYVISMPSGILYLFIYGDTEAVVFADTKGTNIRIPVEREGLLLLPMAGEELLFLYYDSECGISASVRSDTGVTIEVKENFDKNLHVVGNSYIENSSCIIFYDGMKNQLAFCSYENGLKVENHINLDESFSYVKNPDTFVRFESFYALKKDSYLWVQPDAYYVCDLAKKLVERIPADMLCVLTETETQTAKMIFIREKSVHIKKVR